MPKPEIDLLTSFSVIKSTKEAVKKTSNEMKHNPKRRRHLVRRTAAKEVSKIVSSVILKKLCSKPKYRAKFKSIINSAIDKTPASSLSKTLLLSDTGKEMASSLTVSALQQLSILPEGNKDLVEKTLDDIIRNNKDELNASNIIALAKDKLVKDILPSVIGASIAKSKTKV